MEAKELFELFGQQDRSGVFADAECILNLELALYAHAMGYNECALQHYSAALAVSTIFPFKESPDDRTEISVCRTRTTLISNASY